MNRSEPVEATAICRNPKFGLDDRGNINLRFTAQLSDATAADLSIDGDDMNIAIRATGVSSVSDMEGMPLTVLTAGWGEPVVYSGFWKRWTR